jgi:hypothetical protein
MRVISLEKGFNDASGADVDATTAAYFRGLLSDNKNQVTRLWIVRTPLGSSTIAVQKKR